jgi:hypothetical protein
MIEVMILGFFSLLLPQSCWVFLLSAATPGKEQSLFLEQGLILGRFCIPNVGSVFPGKFGWGLGFRFSKLQIA